MYRADIESTQVEGGDNHHILATKSLEGILDLAIALDSPDASLPQLRDQLRGRVYTERALGLIDSLLAAGYIDESRKEFLDTPNPHAEALVLLGLLGESRAQQVLQRKLAVLRELDEKKARRV